MVLQNEQKCYSDDELAEFQAVVEKKLARASREYNYYQDQIKEAEESKYDNRDDWAEEAMVLSDLEVAHTLSERQRKYMTELEYALNRIKNKTYGICKATGELIDKRRLLAVPTTTLSLAAKTLGNIAPLSVKKEVIKQKKAPSKPVIITKIIKKSVPTASINVPQDDDDEYDYDDEVDYKDNEDNDLNININEEYSEEKHFQY